MDSLERNKTIFPLKFGELICGMAKALVSSVLKGKKHVRLLNFTNKTKSKLDITC